MKKDNTQIIRKISLVFFLLSSTIIFILHNISSYFPSVDFICPFGGIETLYRFLASKSFLSKTTVSNIILFILSLFSCIFLGRIFCGWGCSFGALQGFFRWIGSKIVKRKIILLPKFDRFLRLLKYILLPIILYFTYKTSTLIIRPYDPWAAYAHITSGFSELFTEFAVGFTILLITIFLSIFIDRPFCKYLCPLGAFLGIIRVFNTNTIIRDKETCITCKKCDQICPMNIEIMEKEKVSSSECINCFECISKCPTKKETLKLKTFRIKINPLFSGILIVTLFLLTYILGSLVPIQGLSLPITKQQISIDNPTNSERLNFVVPAGFDIKGSMSISEIALELKISPSEVIKILGLPEDAPIDIPLRDFIEQYGTTVQDLKNKIKTEK